MSTAAAAGVHWYGFRYWKNKLDLEAAGGVRSGETKLVAVKVSTARAGCGGAEIRIRVGGGRLVEVSRGFDTETLRRVLSVLEGR